MRKQLLLAFFCLLMFGITAQEINHQLYQKTWLDNESRTFYGYSIMKVFGHNPHWPSAYNVMPITAISYKNLNQLKTELKEQAIEEDWPDDELSDALRDLEFSSRGGELQIYISRYQELDANFRWFFVVIRGKEDKGKLWEYELGYQAAEVPYERGWWNYITVSIPVETELPFYVYLNDKQSNFLSDFKFKIEKITEINSTDSP